MSEDDAGRVRIASALEATGAFEGPLDVDLGNLTACDASPLDPAAFPSSGGASATEAALERGRDVLQRLVADLFSLPSESDVNGRYVQLPPGTTPFPRVKPLPPQVKPMTKWEQFAKEKGIKKRKRSKLVFDEEADEWKRRHGKDRVSDKAEVLVMDGKWSEQGGNGEDPFTREARERRERVEKNLGRQQKNLQNAVATHGAKVLPPTLRMSAAPKKGAKALPLNGMGKKHIADLTSHVARSTASIGKFNAPVPGDEKIKTRGKRRQFDAVTDTSKDRANGLGFIDKLVRREKDFEVDVNLAARKTQRAKEAEARGAKMAKLAEKTSAGGAAAAGKRSKSAAGLKAKGGSVTKKKGSKSGGKK
jgi:regulator of ribosome biosynthesis